MRDRPLCAITGKEEIHSLRPIFFVPLTLVCEVALSATVISEELWEEPNFAWRKILNTTDHASSTDLLAFSAEDSII